MTWCFEGAPWKWASPSSLACAQICPGAPWIRRPSTGESICCEKGAGGELQSVSAGALCKRLVALRTASGSVLHSEILDCLGFCEAGWEAPVSCARGRFKTVAHGGAEAGAGERHSARGHTGPTIGGKSPCRGSTTPSAGPLHRCLKRHGLPVHLFFVGSTFQNLHLILAFSESGRALMSALPF